MAEHVADFEWHADGEEAEIFLYAPDADAAEIALERSLPAARLPGVLSPVHAASGGGDYGHAAVSGTHAAPDLASVPQWGLLLVADAPAESVAGAPGEIPRLISRRLSETVLPGIGEAQARALSESGAAWAAEEGLIEEEDLPFLLPAPGDPDTLGRRSLSAAARDWARPGTVRAFRVAEVLDADGAGEAGLEEVGAFALVVLAGSEDPGRLALAAHRARISARAASGDFGASLDLPAAPVETEEAHDLLLASAAAANYAAGRAGLVMYALRRALREEAGALSLRAAWRIGGLDERNETILHRDGLAEVGEGAALVAGRTVAAGTAALLGSAPPFEAPEEDGRWPWEEASLLSRWATLEPL